MTDTILTIDLGLTNCKTVLFRLDGTVLERAAVAYPTTNRRAGWVEQEPEEWLNAAQAGLKEIDARSPAALQSVQALSVTAHMHSLVCAGEDGAALAPCMVLGDQRSLAEAEEITARVGLERIYHITGARMDASMPLAKILWLKKHAPEIHRRARVFLAAKDWLRSRLAAGWYTDPIDACGASLYDLKQATWSAELVEIAGIRAEQLPQIANPCSTAGALSSEAAAWLGLRGGIPVVVGAGDDVEVLGNGLLEAGRSLEHLGTTGSILTVSDALVYDPSMAVEVYPHVVEGLWVLGGSVTAAGMALSWADGVLGIGNAADETLLSLPDFDDPLIFLPHLAGERCPAWEPRARGSWIGLSISHTRADLFRAAMEGIAFSLKNVLEQIEELAGVQQSISVAQHEYSRPGWANLRAAVYERPLAVLNTEEPTGLGAMALAAVGIGAYPDLPTAVHALAGNSAWINPDEERAATYRRLYRMYLGAAESMRRLMLDWRELKTGE